MNSFQKLCASARAQKLRWLLIGGHAVAQHGYGRTTEDTDFLVCRDDVARWHELARSCGYTLFHEGSNFSQWTAPEDDSLSNLDFMIVTGTTFDKLLVESVPANVFGEAMRLPSLNHLLALKFHALKGNTSLRVLKDLDDVIQLLVVNRVNVDDDEFRQLVLKFADAALYEKLRNALKNES